MSGSGGNIPFRRGHRDRFGSDTALMVVTSILCESFASSDRTQGSPQRALRSGGCGSGLDISSGSDSPIGAFEVSRLTVSLLPSGLFRLHSYSHPRRFHPRLSRTLEALLQVRNPSASGRDQERVTDACRRHLKPGGKIEIAEGRTRFFCNDDSFPETCYTYKWLVCSHYLGVAPSLSFSWSVQIRPKTPRLIFTSTRPSS